MTPTTDTTEATWQAETDRLKARLAKAEADIKGMECAWALASAAMRMTLALSGINSERKQTCTNRTH